MLGTILQLDKQQHVGLQRGKALDNYALPGQRVRVIFIGGTFDPRAR